MNLSIIGVKPRYIETTWEWLPDWAYAPGEMRSIQESAIRYDWNGYTTKDRIITSGLFEGR